MDESEFERLASTMLNRIEAALEACGADLDSANLEAAIFRGANLSLARLERANVKDTDFTDSNWWRARGLSLDQIKFLGKQFPPTEKSAAALSEDFQAWIKSAPTVKQPEL